MESVVSTCRSPLRVHLSRLSCAGRHDQPCQSRSPVQSSDRQARHGARWDPSRKLTLRSLHCRFSYESLIRCESISLHVNSRDEPTRQSDTRKLSSIPEDLSADISRVTACIGFDLRHCDCCVQRHPAKNSSNVASFPACVSSFLAVLIACARAPEDSSPSVRKHIFLSPKISMNVATACTT